MGSIISWRESHNWSERKSSKKKMGMMVKGALFMCLLQAVLSKHIYPVSDPYRWDESFTVELPRIDDEHRGLFNAILLIERDNTKEHLTDAYIKYRDHFEYEEGLFSQTKDDEYVDSHKMKHKTFMDKMTGWSAPVSQDQLNWAKNWLVQHIKNTDFEYVGEMPHSKPRPYTWDHSFEVFYARLDDEHVGLFDAIRESVNHPEDAEKYESLKKLMKEHFDYEEAQFLKIKGQEFQAYAQDHIAKHKSLMDKLNSNSVPLDCDFIDFVEVWLVQHIRNTDFAYRGHMLHDVPNPYVWDESFTTFYKRI